MEQQQLSPMDTNNSASSTTLSEIPATVLDESSGPGVSEASEVILSDVVHRRTSLRPRRAAVAEGSFISDKELDVLLAEPSQSTPSMAQANDAPGRDASDEFEKWVEVEQILKIRRTAPFHDRSTPETLGCRAEQYAYFVKFRDQSYWHCDWIPGQTILFMHPGMVKNYHKRNQELVDLVDQEYRDLQSGHETLNVLSPKLPSSDDDSTVDDTSAAESTNIAPIIGGKLAMSLLDTQPKRGRRRYRYYLENGVPFSYLYPETVLEIGDVFQPTTLSQCRHRGRNRAKKSTIYSAHLREVLVKWTQLDEGQATWETVEMDLAHLEVMLPKYRRAGFIPLDPCGRRLLPTFVRRWILQLVDAHLTQVASLYSSHLGDASDKLLELVAGGRAKTRQRSPPPEWQKNWTGGQPSYLSAWEGGKLHPYQLEGVRWLRHSFYQRTNAILADEMGLGKTVQVVAMLYALLKEDKLPGPFLIVGPLSTTTNWKREFSFWAPEMQVILYTGDRQNRSMINEYCLYLNKSSNIPAFHAMITSYEMVSLERATLCSFHWQTLIVDEAHRLKNKQSRLFRDLSSYNVEFKILLTGTPLQNNLDELVHLLHFLDPIKFNDFHNLNGQWATMTREERMGHLHNILKGHLLRRMKRDVIKDLPKKTETVVPLSLTHLQKRIYKLVLTKNYEQLRTRNLMNTLLHLQKICNHPYLMPAGDEVAPRLSGGIYEPRKLVEASAKLDLVMRMLPRLKEDGHRVLIFSHFIGMLDLIEIALRNEGFSFERIDGSIRGTLRQTAIDRFNAHNATPFVFLLSTRAGCEGINLASADTVILFDSDWNPHRDLQALARAHRIGQSRHVFIYRLIMRDTVEERILQVAHKKLALTKVVIDDDRKGDGSKKMSNLLRLSHSEAHNILKTGLEVLFAGDGDDEEEEGDKAVKQVESGVDQMSSTAGQISQSDHEDTDAPKQQPRPQSIVYDDEALARLLDRTRVVASDESVGAVDEYLSAFNSAHFAECQENLTVNGTDKIATTASQPADKPDVDPNEISQFWDSLLKRRHERLMSQEAQQRRSGVCRSMENCFTDASMVVIEDSDDSDHHGSPSTNGDDAGCGADAEVEFVSLVAGTRSLLFSTSGTRTKPEVVEENGDAYGLVQRRKSCRRPRPTAACLSTFHNVSQVDDEESETRRQRISRRFRRVEDSDNDFCPDTEESSDEVDNVEDVETWMRGSHMGEQGNSSAPTRNQNKGKKRKQLFTTNDDEHLQRALPTLDELQLAELYRQINWRTDSHSIYATWKDFSAQLSEDVVFSEDGKMTVYGFDAHDRQVFLESVMRYGLPPMGILPPPEWLPFSLRSKPPLSLFAYTNLFMRHLYEDPKVLDTETLRWSDGLPTEGVSGIMVLSRIAMIALIRAKVIQFEDYNAVPRRYKKTTDSRFRFAIHEGGLTMLSLVWKQEMAELETRFAQVQTESTSPQTGKHRLFSVILRKWHYRHDFWLLAGIHAHGYAAFMEILADKRFSMVLLGLAERILPPEKADPFVRQKSDADLISEMRESCAFSAEIVAFLVDRLRMLEHALLVEQALASVTLAALGQTSADSTPEPPEALLKKNQELLSVFSSRLTQKGPIKRIDLPSDPEIAEKVKRAVFDLHLLLEDLYADMPGLPAALVCDGVDFAQPRFFTDSALSQPAARQPLAPSHLECHSPPPPEPSPSDPSCGPVPAQPPPTALLSPPAVDTTTVIEISDSD